MGDRYQPTYGRAPAPDYDYYGRREPEPRPQPRYHDERPGSDYTFRGAADRQPASAYHHPQENFSFRAINGPAAPHFPPAERLAAAQPHPSRSRRVDEHRRGRGRGGERRALPGDARENGTRGRGSFRPRAAHTRDILTRTNRQSTPEQLQGMNGDHQARFMELDSSSEDSDADEVIDLTRDSDEEPNAQQPRKKAKIVHDARSSAVPKWSNPDPYTVLPPPETLGAPKKDIVQVIRKAKAEPAPQADVKNEAKEGADFISLDDELGDDVGSDSDESLMMLESLRNVPTGPSSGLQASTYQVQQATFGANGSLPVLPSALDDTWPPRAPTDFVMPDDDELYAEMASDGSCKKRKFADPGERAAETIVTEWVSDGRSDPTPWCKPDHTFTDSPADRLHKEICDFFEFVRPHPYEEAVRLSLIERVQDAVADPDGGRRDVSIRCFGSFAAGLYLPTADMDLVAVSDGYMRGRNGDFGKSGQAMRRFAQHLTKAGIAPYSGVIVVAKAKVPIVKFTERTTGIKVDISFENDSGLRANETFRVWKSQYPAMPVIVVLVKQLLAMRGLNEVYLGGIGGFTIICLVVSMLQHMPEIQSGAMDGECHYGDLLLNFLDLYGNKLDIEGTGLVMNPPGYFDKRKEPYRTDRQNPKRLTIIDPNRPENDISGGSSKINDVLDVFRRAHAALQRRLHQVYEGIDLDESVLGCVWGGNYASFIHQREKLSMLHRGYAVSPPPAPALGKFFKKRKPREDMQHARKHELQAPPPDRNHTSAQPPLLKHALPARPQSRTGVSGNSGNANTPRGVELPAHAQQASSGLRAQDQELTAKNRGDAAESKGATAMSDKQRHKAKLRARAFKKAHPDVEVVPRYPTQDEIHALEKRHKLNIRPTKSTTTRVKKRKVQRERALKSLHSELKGVPNRLTEKERQSLENQHSRESKQPVLKTAASERPRRTTTKRK